MDTEPIKEEAVVAPVAMETDYPETADDVTESQDTAAAPEEPHSVPEEQPDESHVFFCNSAWAVFFRLYQV